LHGFSIWLNPFVMMINFGTTQNWWKQTYI
jgi:hypothetical protein